MRRAFIVIAAFYCFLIPSTAYACSCATRDPASALNSAKAVFIGRMLGGTEKLSVKDQKGKAHSIEAGRVRFTVEEIFKGGLANEVSIQIASMDGTSCGPYGLKRGERYIVYAYGDEKDQEKLYSGVCTRTRPLSNSDSNEDLDFLRSLPPAGTGGNLRGSIWADVKQLRGGGASPMSNVKVNIRSAGTEVITVVTNKDGEFEVKKLKPGKYRIEPEFPANYKSENAFAEVTVDDRGTADVGFEAYIDGRVSGHILDKDGRAYNSIFLHLETEEKSAFGHSTSEGGAFVVQGVPPGEYVLYLELQNSDYKKNQNYYYPGTFRREDATVIKVGMGEKIEGVEFLLPDEFKVRTIEGQVLQEDGSPAGGVEVMLLCPRSAKPDGFVVEFGPTSITADEQGRFKLDGFAGEVYWIEARGTRKGDQKSGNMAVHSPSKKIDLSENLKDIKLVLSEDGFSLGCGK